MVIEFEKALMFYDVDKIHAFTARGRKHRIVRREWLWQDRGLFCITLLVGHRCNFIPAQFSRCNFSWCFPAPFTAHHANICEPCQTQILLTIVACCINSKKYGGQATHVVYFDNGLVIARLRTSNFPYLIDFKTID